MNDFDNAPVLQFPQTIADVRARYAQRFTDVLGSKGFRRQIQQGMDLSDGAVDSPLKAHLPPMKDKLLLHWRKRRHLYFSSYRNIRIHSPSQEDKPRLDLRRSCLAEWPSPARWQQSLL